MKKARSTKDASFLDGDGDGTEAKPSAKRSRRAKSKKTPDPHGRKPRWKRWTYWVSVVGVWGLIVLGVGVAWIAWDLPDADQAIVATRQPTIRVVSADGVLIARRGDRYGAAVRLEDVPPTLPHAILATEDRRFYDHFGVDVFGIARAMWVNLKAGGIKQGGSTLTQQAAKNLFLEPKRTLKRKLQELVLALWLEAKFTKDEILTIYMNRVYFGQGVYGVDAAARQYFQRPAGAVTPYQAAVLAGMLKGPNRYNPITNPQLAMDRAEVVISNLVAAEYMSQADADAIARPRALPRARASQLKPMAYHFVDWALDQAGDYVTLDRDVTVHVSLDSRIQRAAKRAVDAMMRADGPARARGAGQIALVALSPEGRVTAMVGSRDYGESQYNRAVQAERQPGSAFKPVVYLAGFDAGLTPETVIEDGPVTVEDWSPSNFKNEYLGPITLNAAMTRSINTVAVKVSERAGRDVVQNWARKLGLSGAMTDEPSLALGVSEVTLLDLTAAYAPFANGGFGVWPYAIEKITDRDGRALYERRGGGPGRVMPPGYAGAMNAMLANVIESPDGTGQAARLDRPAAGKTGTSQDYRDAWFVGYTADMVAGVWMGNDNASPMQGVTGGTLPARAWRDFMAAAHQGRAPRPLPTGAVDGTSSAPGAPDKVKSFFEKMLQSIFGD